MPLLTQTSLEPRLGRSIALPSLRRNFTWTLAGNITYAGCQWMMLVILAKLGTPEMVGTFALGLAVTAPIILFFNLSLRAVLATDAQHQFSFAEYLGLRILTSTTAAVILLVGLAKVFESFSDILYGILQNHERMDRIATSMMIKGLLSLIALAACVAVTRSPVWGAAGMGSAWALVPICYDWRNCTLVLDQSRGLEPSSRPTLKPVIRRVGLARLAWLALPMGVVMMLCSLSANIPRYFIERQLGPRELGIFAAIASLMVAGNTIINALGEAVIPRLSKLYAVGNTRGFWDIVLKFLAVAAALAGAGLLISQSAGRQILALIYRPEYAQHSDTLVVLMIVAASAYFNAVLGTAVTAMRNFRAQPLMVLANVVCTSVGCYFLIPVRGLNGAAWAMFIGLAGQAVTTILIIWATRRRRDSAERHGTQYLAVSLEDA
jgi:O-antigen/teichoic acid export membrane protein